MRKYIGWSFLIGGIFSLLASLYIMSSYGAKGMSVSLIIFGIAAAFAGGKLLPTRPGKRSFFSPWF